MKKLALALLAIFVLPASLSATKPVEAAAAATEQSYVAWTTKTVSNAVGSTYNGVWEHKYKTLAGVLIAVAGYLAYSKHCPHACTSANAKKAK